MLGKKGNLKLLISKLWEVGVTIVKTTKFVQGQTSHWGLAWSFMPTARKIIAPPIVKKGVLPFMLQGIKRQYTAVDVLHSVEEFFKSCGASCKLTSSTFSLDIVASSDQCNKISNGTRDVDSVRSHICENSHWMAPACKSLKITYLSTSWFVRIWFKKSLKIAFTFFKSVYDDVPTDARNVAYKRIIAAER